MKSSGNNSAQIEISKEQIYDAFPFRTTHCRAFLRRRPRAPAPRAGARPARLPIRSRLSQCRRPAHRWARQKLNEQFAIGLREYLAEAAQKRFDVSPSAGKTALPQNARALTLEGELSRTPSPDGGAYLLVVRLYQDKPTHQIIAQWAGVAQNYRYLTGNLENRPTVNREGLLGETGKQIAVFAAAFSAAPPSADPLSQLTDTAQGHVLATVVPDGAASGTGIASPTLQSGQAFRLQIAAQNAGAAYIVREADTLVPLWMPVPGSKTEESVAPGKPVLIPPAQAPSWKAPDTDKPVTQTLLVLVRRSNPAPLAPQAAAPAFRPAAFPGLQSATDDSLPVQVIRAFGDIPPAPVPGTADPVRDQLTQMLSADPAGTWTAQRITLQILPALPKKKP